MNALDLPVECSLCSRRVSRLWAQFATVVAGAPSDPLETEIGISGFCREHREEVAKRLAAQVQSAGEVVFLMDPAIELRPHEVGPFLQSIEDRLLEL